MDISFLLFISSGLFLGWSLGANDAANIFGTAVGSRMLRFATAAIICSLFVTLGAVTGGAGAAGTLGSLGGVDAIAGAFMVALAAGLTVLGLIRSGLSASTTQAVVGSIIGWNLYTGSVTDSEVVFKVVATWIICPLLAGAFAVALTKIAQQVLFVAKPHLLKQDAWTRFALIVTGAFGAYTLGANNIGNVMGMFMSVTPFEELTLGPITLNPIQQLFFIGAVAISVGVITYSKRTMLVVSDGLTQMSPVAGWIVVLSHSLVLFIFASQGLQQSLLSIGLPPIPLVPVSSSQAVIGAVVGIGLLKGVQTVNWPLLRRIATGWVITPVAAAVISMTGLFFVQEMFKQPVITPHSYLLTPQVLEELTDKGFPTERLVALEGASFTREQTLINRAAEYVEMDNEQRLQLVRTSREMPLYLNPYLVVLLDQEGFSPGQYRAVKRLSGQRFDHAWQLDKALDDTSPTWRKRPDSFANKAHNQTIDGLRKRLYSFFVLPLEERQ